MSYDICLQKIIDGDRGICTPDEARACIDLLAKVTSETPDEYNFLVLEFEDGSSVECAIWKDENAIDGCMFFTRGLSRHLTEFIFEMAVAGNFVILDTGGSDSPDSPVAILPSKDLMSTIGQDIFEHPKVCESAAELSKILGVSSEEWAAYRDRVVSSHDGE